MKSVGSGGLGMCYCQFDNNRTLIPFEEITKVEYESRLKEKELKK